MSGKSLKLAKSLLAAAVASTLLVTVCSAKGNGEASAATKGGKAAASTKKDEKTITTKEGDIQLTVGSDWKVDSKNSTNGTLVAMNPSKDQYVTVTSISKSELPDGATLDDFKQAYTMSIELMSKNYKEIETKDIKIIGVPAKQVEFSAEINNVKAHCLIFLVGKGNTIYQIIAQSPESKFANNKKVLLKVGQSFKVLKESSPPASAPKKESEAPLTVLTSDDKTMEISLPAGWKKESKLNAVAQIQASLITEAKWMIVISENKEIFTDEMTVKDYYDLSIEEFSNLLENAKISEAKNVKIGELSALQTEIQGEINKVKVMYLVTIVESPKQFTEIIFWTVQQKMDKSRDMFIKAVQTYKEPQ